MKVNVALFYAFNDKMVGFYLSENKKVIEITNLVDLVAKKDTLWITNIPDEMLNNNKTKIKGSNYIGSDINQVLKDNFVENENVYIQLRVLNKIIKSFFWKIKKEFNISIYDVSRYSYVYNKVSEAIQIDKSETDIIKIKETNAKVAKILEDIGTSFLSIEDSVNVDLLYYSKYKHVFSLCKIDLPYGDWVEYPIKKFYESNATIEDWVKSVSNKYLFIVFCKMTNINNDVQKIIKNRLDENNNIWLTSAEVDFFIKYSNLSFKKIFISENKVNLVTYANRKLFKEKDTISINSYFNGLVAKNYLKGILSNSNLVIQKYWVNIYDKLMMTKIAVFLNHKGYEVTGYGKGSILLKNNIEEYKKIELINICDNLKLINNI